VKKIEFRILDGIELEKMTHHGKIKGYVSACAKTFSYLADSISLISLDAYITDLVELLHRYYTMTGKLIIPDDES